MNPNAYCIDPLPHNVKDKHDVIDWEQLPKGECDMNYRLPRGDLWLAIGRAVTLLFVAAVIGAGLGALVRWTSPLWSLSGWSVAGGMGVVLLTATWTLYAGRTRRDLQLALAVLSAGVAVLVSASLTPLQSGPQGWLAAWVFAAPLVGLALADTIGVDAVWWFSANPRLSRQSMLGWRDDWRRRWVGVPKRPPAKPTPTRAELSAHRRAMRLRDSLPAGLVWLIAAWLVGVLSGVLLAAFAPTTLIATPVVMQTTLVLAAACVARCGAETLRTLGIVALAFIDFCQDAPACSCPPWVWRSPTGPSHKRHAIVAIAVAALAYLAAGAAAGETLSVESHFCVRFFLPAIAAMLAPIWLVLMMATVSGPALVAHYDALEATGAREHQATTEWDGYIARLQSSRNSLERRSTWIGCHRTLGYPILLDDRLRFEHTHVVGGTGTGKTALAVASDLVQFLRRPRGSDKSGDAIVVIDCKGDQALLQTVRLEAEASGRTFKWFTNMPHRSTHFFNPLTQLQDAELSLSDVVAAVAQSLSLYHGEAYGRGFFGAGARAILQAALQSSANFGGLGAPGPPIQSFADLEQALREVCATPDEYQAAKHVAYVLAQLSAFEQVNLTPGRPQTSPELLEAIHMPTAIRNGEVIYFYLVGAMDLSSVGHLARLAMYSTLAAAQHYRFTTKKRPSVQLFADEAQCLISQSLQPILEQARSYGIACTLSHQNHSQLAQPGGPDLRELVLSNTAIKRYHSIRDPAVQKYVSQMSGRVLYYLMSWDQLKRRAVGQGVVSPRYACTGPDGVMRVGVQTAIGDRIEAEDQADMNRRLQQSIAIMERSEGLTQFNGGLVMHSDWPVSRRDYDERERMPWPGDPLLPHIVTATTHPEIDLDATDAAISERLKRVRDRLLPPN